MGSVPGRRRQPSGALYERRLEVRRQCSFLPVEFQVGPVLGAVVLIFGLAAIPEDPVSAQGQAQQGVAQRCFEHHRFGANPVDVAKTADGSMVLAQTNWNWHDTIGCFLTLDYTALAALRAAPAPQELPDAPTDASERCFGHHKFGERPVDVAKSADGQTVLARLSWGHHDSIGCYLTLDDEALAALRVAANDIDATYADTEDGTTDADATDTDADATDTDADATDTDADATDTDADATDTGTEMPQADPQFTLLATGVSFSCALRADQAVACWGDNRYGQIDAPGGRFTAVAVGSSHSCALRADQAIVCWGNSLSGRVDAPGGRFTAVAVSSSHSCALRADQAVACWGDNRYGQIDAPGGRFTAVAVSSSHSCAIRADQSIACWGNSWGGRADAPPGRFTAVAVSSSHSCAIRADQSIACWGILWDGRPDAPDARYTAIAVSSSHLCALRADQAVACWANSWGARADAPDGRFTAVAVGDSHSCARRADQTVACWGENNYGQANAPDGQFTAIAVGDSHSCARRADQTVACWGSNQHGQTSVPLRLGKPQADIVDVRIALESDPAASAERSFEVAIEFTEDVTGFDAGDITVVNGDVTSFSGAGSEFRAAVRASFPGRVVMWVGRGAVQDLSGNSNEPSQPLVARAGQANPAFFDTWDKGAVLAEFAAEFDREEPDPGWTGDLARCIAGTTSQEYRDSIFQRMNWYRQMAGVVPIVEDPELARTAQAKALILAAEGRLGHHPTPFWACYSRVEFRAESIANISGINSIDGYMRDPGSNNQAVGHRRMITSRRLGPFGTGDIPGRANVLHARISSGQGEVREQRGFVTWPPPGYIPHETVWGRWSFTLPDADFTNAAVAVADNGGPVEVQIIYNQPVVEPGIVWAMDRDEQSARHPRPIDGDLCYAVAITGVKIEGETQPPYEYATCVTDRSH